MKALSVRQPWASLIAAGTKTIELRTWKTHYRGPLAICSSSKPDPWSKTEPPLFRKDSMPLGVVCCIVEVLNCRPSRLEDAAAACVDDEWDPEGHWSWELGEVTLTRPVPVKGRLNIYRLPEDVVTMLRLAV